LSPRPRGVLTTSPVSKGGIGVPRKTTSFGAKCNVRPCGPHREVHCKKRIDSPAIFRGTRRQGRKQQRSRGCLTRCPYPGFIAKPLNSDLVLRARISPPIKPIPYDAGDGLDFSSHIRMRSSFCSSNLTACSSTKASASAEDMSQLCRTKEATRAK